MAKSRHDRIIEILFELAKGYKGYNKVYADHISEDYKIINILSHYKRRAAEVFPYRPDMWCKYKKNNKIDIFEVWDNQSEDACVEDILFAALTPNIEFLYIVCLQKEQYELALKLTRVILASIFNDDGNLFINPSEMSKYIQLVPEDIIDDDAKIKRFLRDKLAF